MKMMVRDIRRRWWFKWLLVGVVIRLLLMPVTLHPDLWGHSFTSYFFAYEGRLNIYEYLANLPQSHPLVRNFGVTDIFIYPPLTYFTLGTFRILLKPFTDANFIPWLMENLGQVYTYKGLFWQLFLFKTPYLFIDVALAFVLAHLFKEQRNKKLAFGLWMFNPLALYATFMIGQLDLLPVFLTVLALYFVAKKRYAWALLSLGIGGSFKMYPLLFIMPAAFIFGRGLKERIGYIFVGFLPFVVSVLPFLASSAFRQMVLFAPKSQKMLFMGWPVSGAEVIFPFVLFLILIYFYAYYSKKSIPISYFFLSILLLIFSVTHYHPQWFLWVTPFLIWELVENRFKHLIVVLILFASWLLITLFFEPSLSFGLFNPIWPKLAQATGLSEVAGRYINVFQLKSLVRSVFAGASVYYILSIFKIFNNEKRH